MRSKANQYYFTYWHGDKGELYKPVFKVQGQLGVRWPSNCYVTWCSFGYGWSGDWRQKLIPLESVSNYWINKSNQERVSGDNYPYWYEKYTR